jgi:serine/threonine protein kinase
MELLNGETLAQRIARSGRLTAAEALPIARQVGAGLAEVHALNIVHGDLKPANIMLVHDEIRGERAVLMDFV